MPSLPEPGLSNWTPPIISALIVFADGLILEGRGFGAEGEAVGEICFNTAMTGYEEILTDPSYAGQIITFTFPHLGIVGANDEDTESAQGRCGARGVLVRADVCAPSNYRAQGSFDDWAKARGIIGISGVDTRALTAHIRRAGMPNALIAHHADGIFDRAALLQQACAFRGIDGVDLVPEVGATQRYAWSEASWTLEGGYRKPPHAQYRVVAIDYGVKHNILRLLADRGCEILIVPATANAAEILALEPDGVFLSNGPGDPAETGRYAVPTIQALLQEQLPLFGICLGHQLLGLALGAKTMKMAQGHHGANHPVKDERTGKVEIVSMNHGFALDPKTLPDYVRVTHTSLFDGTNCGIALVDRPVFSVQYHPEASPGPHDSHHLFSRFVEAMARRKGLAS